MQRRDVEVLDDERRIGETTDGRGRMQRLPVEHRVVEARQKEDADGWNPAEIPSCRIEAQADACCQTDKCRIDGMSGEADDIIAGDTLRGVEAEAVHMR